MDTPANASNQISREMSDPISGTIGQTTQKPSVGRIVHYVGKRSRQDKPVCRAAIVTEVNPDVDTEVMLGVFYGGMSFPERWIGQDEDMKTEQTWHWPERV